MRRLALILALLLTGCATDPWSRADVERQAAYIALSVVDTGQTLDIKNHDGIRELNFVLGENPSDKRIVSFMVTTRVLHTLAVHFMPADWRPAFQWASIGVELGAVTNNASLGLQLKF